METDRKSYVTPEAEVSKIDWLDWVYAGSSGNLALGEGGYSNLGGSEDDDTDGLGGNSNSGSGGESDL